MSDHEPTCRTCGAPAECWAIYATPVGDVRVAMCADCLDCGERPHLSWLEAVELAIELESAER